MIIKTAQVLCMSNEFYINEDDGLEKFVDVKEDILPEEDFSDTFSGWEWERKKHKHFHVW